MSREMDFWARRRRAVAEEARAEEAAHAAALEAEAAAAQEAKSDEEVLAELDLPNPDTLTSSEEVRAFMSKAVPDRLRRRALRTLWRMNPVLANVDGLVDYGEDFTDSATVVENLQTAYQVGKGMLAHVEEMARQAEAKAAAENGETPEPEPEPELEPDWEPQTQPEALALADPHPKATPDPAPTQTAELAPETLQPRPRRMQFTFSPSQSETA